MKKIATLIVILILVLSSSCSDNKMSIEGTIDDKYNGKTVYLYTVDPSNFSDFNLLTTTTVSDGYFCFEDLNSNKDINEKNLPTVGYLSLFDINMAEEEITEENEDAPIATIILEKGVTNVIFSDNSVTVGGTARNDEFNKMHQAITNLVEFSTQFSSFEDLDSLPVDAEGKDGRARLQELDNILKESSYSFINANMTNSVGEYLFLRSGDEMFTPSQMLELINTASEGFQSRTEIQRLKNILIKMEDGTLQMEDLEAENIG